MTSEPSPPTPPPQVRVAGGSVGVQGLLGVAFAVVLATRAAGLPAVAEAVYFALVGAALVGVGRGLLRGRRWARTPAIVAQLLLLPVVYSLIGAHQWLLGIGGGAVVVATFLLLISEPTRAWSMRLPGPDVRR